MVEVLEEPAQELGEDLLGLLWSPRFPSTELVEQAAALVPQVRQASGRGSEIAEGPHWEFSVAPGMVSVRSKDYARAERTHERQVKAHRATVDQLARHLVDTGEHLEDPEPGRVITGWSRKSRSNMVERLCTLDYAPLFPVGRLPAMVTLTYPGCWLPVAPNGKAVKKHLKAFRKRWSRAWGEDLVCVWKLEFQGRREGARCEHCGDDDGRAPHVHMLLAPPHGTAKTTGETFATWLSRTWADVVDHPDPEQRAKNEAAGTGIDWNDGLRSTDPKRVAVYFTKHGAFKAKDYQHRVPHAWQQPGQGPGRFWGYWGLKQATTTVEVTPETAVHAARTIRRWARAQGTTRQVTKPRVEQATGRVRYRSTRTRVQRMGNGGRGFVSVNDGAAFASQLARHLNAMTSPHPTRSQDRTGAGRSRVEDPKDVISGARGPR